MHCRRFRSRRHGIRTTNDDNNNSNITITFIEYYSKVNFQDSAWQQGESHAFAVFPSYMTL